MKRRTDHVVVNYAVQPPVFECRRCHATMPTGLPSSVSVFVLRSKAFTLEHRDCRAAGEEATP